MNNLRRARLDADVSQLKLMKESGIHYSVISKLENGWITPSKKQKEKLACVLGVDPNWLFPRDERSKSDRGMNGKSNMSVEKKL